MRRISMLALLCAVVATATPALAQITASKAGTTSTVSSAEAEQIRAWYRDYLGREPGAELTAWVQLLRGGMSPVDVQAMILGSDEFYNQQGRDPQTFILETLQAVTWQAPSGALLRQWNDRLTALRGDRFTLAREILFAYSQPQNITGGASDIAARLVSAAKLLQDTANFELSGTTQGRQVALRASSLYSACEGLQKTVSVRNYRQDDALASARAVESAYNAVQATLNNPPGTAPSSTAIARRIDSMLNDLQAVLMPQSNPYPTNPTTPLPTTPTTPSSPTGTAYDVAKLQKQLESVARGTQSVAQIFSSQPSGNYTYRVLLTDLNSFASQIDAMETSIARGTSLQKLQWDWQALYAQAQRLRPQVLNGNPPTFTRLFWTSVESGLEQMGETLGMAPNGNPGTVPPISTAKPNTELIAICDQAVGQTDAFLTGLSPYVFGIPEVPKLQTDMRTLRNQILTVRQMIVQQSPTVSIQDQVRLARLQYEAAYDVWSAMVDGYRLTNYTKISPIGRSLTALEEGLTGVSSDPNVYLRPGTQTRVAELIATFDTELARYQKTLQPFANYPEYRNLVLFAEQLAGYSKNLKQLEVDRARNLADEQRLVAGMQRVVDLVETYNTRLEEGAGRSNDRNALTQALELRRSLSRIANLVNDLEHEIR